MTTINGGQWPNPNIINCISNKSTLKFCRTNIFDGSSQVVVKEIIDGRLLTYQHLTKLLQYTNTTLFGCVTCIYCLTGEWGEIQILPVPCSPTYRSCTVPLICLMCH